MRLAASGPIKAGVAGKFAILRVRHTWIIPALE
jgi:hypothetical protein